MEPLEEMERQRLLSPCKITGGHKRKWSSVLEESKWVLGSGTYSGLSNTWRTEPRRGEDTVWERRMTISSLPRTSPPSGVNMLS